MISSNILGNKIFNFFFHIFHYEKKKILFVTLHKQSVLRYKNII